MCHEPFHLFVQFLYDEVELSSAGLLELDDILPTYHKVDWNCRVLSFSAYKIKERAAKQKGVSTIRFD